MISKRRLLKWVVIFVVLFIPIGLTGASWELQASPTPSVSDEAQVEKLKAERYPAWVGDSLKLMIGEYQESEHQGLGFFEREPGDTTYWYRTTLQSYVDSNWEIYTFPGFNDPITKTRLTSHPGSDVYPRFNLGSTRIAFASNRDGNYEIYTMNAAGSDLQRLTWNQADDSIPVWSHDGSRIVFSSERDGNVELYMMNSDGSGQARLTFDSAVDIDATWSPDDTRIAWMRTTGEGGTVWIMDADGSNKYPFSVWCHFAQNLNWSPDGSKLVFDCDTNMDYWNEIVLLDAVDGSTAPLYHLGEYLLDYWVSGWTPDSRYVWANRIQYVLHNGGIYLSDTSPFAVKLLDGTTHSVPRGPIDMQLSTERGDSSIPQSHVATLSAYSRASSFPVSWSGWDPGPAPIEFFDLQYKIGPANWVNWFRENVLSPKSPAFFTGSPGQTVFFRSRALDEAGNQEAWPPGDGDAHTRLYTWMLSGGVMDSRAIALPNVPLTTSPDSINDLTGDYLGRYQAWLKNDGYTSIQAVEPVSGEEMMLNLNILDDRVVNIYFPADDSVLMNGGFENTTPPFASWQVSGTLGSTLTSGYVGDHSLLMGHDCETPCLGPVTKVHTTTSFLPPIILPGENGSVHLISGGAHHLWTPDAGWSEAEQVWTPGYQQSPDAVVDHQGNLHIVWVESGYLHYIRRSVSGNWSAVEYLPEGRFSSIAADSSGRVIISYFSMDDYPGGDYGYFYVERKTGGGWKPQVLFHKESQGGLNSIAVDPEGRFHIIAEGDSNSIIHFTFYPDGSMHNEIIAWDELHALDLKANPEGKLHLAWVRELSYEAFYMERDARMGQWSSQVILPESIYSINMAVDLQGEVNIVGNAEPGFYYFHKDSSAGWLPTVLLHEEAMSANADVTVDADMGLHLVWIDDLYYAHQTLSRASVSENVAISQVVSIPIDMHKSTLAFDFSLIGDGTWYSNQFDVLISTGATETLSTTRVFSATSPTYWDHGWLDMSPWMGETISLTFELHQAVGEPLVGLRLDNISFGAWLTPRVVAISPQQVESWMAPQIEVTITGENFIDPPSVYLGSIPVNVDWVDEGQLLFTIPNGMNPGSYEVRVINPGGQQSASPVRLVLGKQYFLPRIANSG